MMGVCGSVGGDFGGIDSDEIVGVTVGAAIDFEGVALLVSVCVKLKTGTSTCGGLTAVKLQLRVAMEECKSSIEAY